MSESENTSLKRQIEELHAENKRLKTENQTVVSLQAENARLKQDIRCNEVKQAMDKLQAALKPRYFRLDYLVCNIPHIALQIFKELDPKSHGNCRLVSKKWNDCIDESKWWWQQQIQHYRCHLKKIERDNDDTTKKKPIKDFRKVLKYVSKEELLGTLKLFSVFMRDYFKFERGSNCEGIDLDLDPTLYAPTPLYFAKERNRMDIFQVCARSPMKNFDFDISDEPGRESTCHPIFKTMVADACKKNQAKFVEFCMNLKGNKRVDFNKLHEGVSLFHEACKSNKVEVVKLFLDRAEELNIDLNVRNEWMYGETPIMEVVTKDVMQLLLDDHRIDSTIIDREGCNVLHHVCKNNFLNIEDEVTEEQISDTITLLLQSSKILFTRDTSIRSTPLHHACFQERPERTEAILKFCQEKNINVNEEDFRGMTAVHIAFDVVSNPDRHRIFLKEPNNFDSIPPIIKVFFNFAKKMEINFEATDNMGRTPLHIMCENMYDLHLDREDKKKYIEKFLILAKTEYGIEFNLKATNNAGKTPFEMLCWPF